MEQQTSITYWEEMHSRYERWINTFDACPVLKININDYDLMKNPKEIEQVIERIGNAMK
jgi:deoxyadenosine/deoxycytidine kinase